MTPAEEQWQDDRAKILGELAALEEQLPLQRAVLENAERVLVDAKAVQDERRRRVNAVVKDSVRQEMAMCVFNRIRVDSPQVKAAGAELGRARAFVAALEWEIADRKLGLVQLDRVLSSDKVVTLDLAPAPARRKRVPAVVEFDTIEPRREAAQ
jgi:hypothetical protein